MAVMTAEITNSTALSFPSNGTGGVTVAFGTDHLSTGSEVYTANTCTATWPGGGDPATGTAVGNLVVTQDGYWGVFQSGTATKVTVDKWRTIQQGVGVPTDGQDCRIYNGKCILVGGQFVYLQRMIFDAVAAGTVDITDCWGNVLYRHTVGASPVAHTVEFAGGPGQEGMVFNRLIGFKSDAAGNTVTFVFNV